MINCHDCHCLLINICVPTDYHSAAGNEQLRETLRELCGFISTVSDDFLIKAGDWNTDIHHPCSFSQIISSFLSEVNLSFVDLLTDNVRFTYPSQDGFTSWPDCVAISSFPPCLRQCIQSWMAQTCLITNPLRLH